MRDSTKKTLKLILPSRNLSKDFLAVQWLKTSPSNLRVQV